MRISAAWAVPPACSTAAATVFEELCQIVDEVIELYHQDGKPLPLPPSTSGRDFANKMLETIATPMPLGDHFRPPLDDITSWEGFHGQWPAMIVQQLNAKLPRGYVAEPRVLLGSASDIDFSEYEVLVYASGHGRRLVAAVEIISPANKDRSENRRAVVQKCEALLRQGVCVAIIDLVTIRTANLYLELADLIGAATPAMAYAPLYAVTCRGRHRGDKWRVEAWEHELTLGQPLPTLPLWLTETFFVPLELEASYEETCRVLRIA